MEFRPNTNQETDSSNSQRRQQKNAAELSKILAGSTDKGKKRQTEEDIDPQAKRTEHGNSEQRLVDEIMDTVRGQHLALPGNMEQNIQTKLHKFLENQEKEDRESIIGYIRTLQYKLITHKNGEKVSIDEIDGLLDRMMYAAQEVRKEMTKPITTEHTKIQKGPARDQNARFKSPEEEQSPSDVPDKPNPNTNTLKIQIGRLIDKIQTEKREKPSERISKDLSKELNDIRSTIREEWTNIVQPLLRDKDITVGSKTYNTIFEYSRKRRLERDTDTAKNKNFTSVEDYRRSLPSHDKRQKLHGVASRSEPQVQEQQMPQSEDISEGH